MTTSPTPGWDEGHTDSGQERPRRFLALSMCDLSLSSLWPQVDSVAQSLPERPGWFRAGPHGPQMARSQTISPKWPSPWAGEAEAMLTGGLGRWSPRSNCRAWASCTVARFPISLCFPSSHWGVAFLP